MTPSARELMYWIATERLDHGGRKVCGPFTTFTDAQVARAYIERLEGHSGYWISSELDSLPVS